MPPQIAELIDPKLRVAYRLALAAKAAKVEQVA
jgi:hypothetical protein